MEFQVHSEKNQASETSTRFQVVYNNSKEVMRLPTFLFVFNKKTISGYLFL